MNKYIILLLVSICFICGCKKKTTEPCEVLVNGVYQFPTLPQDHSNMTREEIDEFFNLPADICSCITTKGLIETCLNFPYIGLIIAGSNPQSGYDLLVKPYFRGIPELETRADRGTFLLQKFLTIDPLGYDTTWQPLELGRFLFKLDYIKIFMGQYVNLEVLTHDEKIALMEKAIVVYEKERSDTKHHGIFELECTTSLMGRLMFQNGYSAMVDAYNSDEQFGELLAFIQGQHISIYTVEFVYNLSKEYLNYLKNN